VLCLGNELLADDGVGLLVADHLRSHPRPGLDVVSACDYGFRLLDYLVGVPVLIVVDAIQTGTAPVGSIHVFPERCLRPPLAGSPHYAGLSEALALGRCLNLKMPDCVVLVAVEVADYSTLGGTLHPAVRAAVPKAVGAVEDLVAAWLCGESSPSDLASADRLCRL